jgi:ABC-type sugar transport system ATPase subunit
MTPQLTVDIIKRLGQTTLEMRFTAEAEILVLFGPSGAGKTQTLQAIAGLSTPDSGQIRFDDAIFFQRMPGKPVVNLPARKRRIGYVFQQYALFPHMSALENVAFPLEGDVMPETARWSCWNACIWRTWRSVCRTNYRAGSNNASPLPALWPPSRISCCSMSHSQPSTVLSGERLHEEISHGTGGAAAGRAVRDA